MATIDRCFATIFLSATSSVDSSEQPWTDLTLLNEFVRPHPVTVRADPPSAYNGVEDCRGHHGVIKYIEQSPAYTEASQSAQQVQHTLTLYKGLVFVVEVNPRVL